MFRVQVSDRGVLAGSAIGAVAGIAWSLWAASGLSHLSAITAVIVGAAGVAVGLLILVPTGLARRAAPAAQRSPSMFSSRRYLLVVFGELAAIIVGTVVLNSTGYSPYIPPWVAFVVGVHFLGFGRFFWRGFYLLGGALIAAGVIGVIVGVVGGGPSWIVVTTGILAAVSLFTSGTRVFRSAPERTDQIDAAR
jgi:low temperature requirement protein LtrA